MTGDFGLTQTVPHAYNSGEHNATIRHPDARGKVSLSKPVAPVCIRADDVHPDIDLDLSRTNTGTWKAMEAIMDSGKA